jgi:hypothetical protein
MGPAMLPQFNLVVETEYVEAFREALETVRVGGQPHLQGVRQWLLLT